LDGYHLLDSIFAAIDLTDRIRISVHDVQPRGAMQVAVHCTYPGVPNDESNLAARAAVTLLEDCGLGARVRIEIDKQIPPGAGLGGGSSNAAAVLRSLTSSLRLEVSETRLHELALQLGADVPFFLTGGCARVRGIGEHVEPIRGWPDLALLIALPPIAVSTAWAFRAYSGGGIHEPAEPSGMASGMPPNAASLVNDLEKVVLAAHPRIADVKKALLEAGSSGTVMSGSGAAVVGLVPLSAKPQDIADRFRATHADVRIHCARILPAGLRPSVDRTASYA
jgi:4-diphosphocytidyl-2-C-methyl-D-erythritol kinase